MTDKRPIPHRLSNAVIIWTCLGVFVLSGLCLIMAESVDANSSRWFCLAVAVLGVLAVMGEMLFDYVIVPPNKDDDADDDDTVKRQ